jgi:hypothetical protein
MLSSSEGLSTLDPAAMCAERRLDYDYNRRAVSDKRFAQQVSKRRGCGPTERHKEAAKH